MKKDKLISYIEKSLNLNREEFESFLSYFIETWVKYFNDESLFLDDIKIKFRSNNCLENFNKQLKFSFWSKKALIF